MHPPISVERVNSESSRESVCPCVPVVLPILSRLHTLTVSLTLLLSIYLMASNRDSSFLVDFLDGQGTRVGSLDDYPMSSMSCACLPFLSETKALYLRACDGGTTLILTNGAVHPPRKTFVSVHRTLDGPVLVDDLDTPRRLGETNVEITTETHGEPLGPITELCLSVTPFLFLHPPASDERLSSATPS